MHAVEKNYTIYLNNECRRRHYHKRVGKWVMEFSIQLELCLADKWTPIVRYDTAHGFAHKDLILPGGKIKKTMLDNIQNFNEALIFSENEIKSNWEIYRKQFLGGVKNER